MRMQRLRPACTPTVIAMRLATRWAAKVAEDAAVMVAGTMIAFLRSPSSVAHPARVARLSIAHGLFRKPVPTFRDHALDRHGPLEGTLVQVLGARGIDDATAIHHGKMVAQLTRKVEVLFHKNDGHLAEPAQVGDGAADAL